VRSVWFGKDLSQPSQSHVSVLAGHNQTGEPQDLPFDRISSPCRGWHLLNASLLSLWYISSARSPALYWMNLCPHLGIAYPCTKFPCFPPCHHRCFGPSLGLHDYGRHQTVHSYLGTQALRRHLIFEPKPGFQRSLSLLGNIARQATMSFTNCYQFKR
jgi:hypothetical protein